MSGPSKTVDLDAIPVDQWKINDQTSYFWKGKLWRKEKIGCVLCVQSDDESAVTLSYRDALDKEHFHCTVHGELFEIAYSLKKVYTINIGGIEREGDQVINDTMLFPDEMTPVDRLDLINKILDEAQKDEDEESLDDDDSEADD